MCICLDTTSSKRQVRYVAISHIWADGLGNPKENAMPRCQLMLLQAGVNALISGAKMDTSGSDTKLPNVPF